MEELTEKEKAKRYDKAIAHAKNLLKTIGNATLGNLVLKNEFKNMFPELAESEDERIRKDLIEWIDDFPDTIWQGHYKKDVLAWLEKQNSNVDNANKEY